MFLLLPWECKLFKTKRLNKHRFSGDKIFHTYPKPEHIPTHPGTHQFYFLECIFKSKQIRDISKYLNTKMFNTLLFILVNYWKRRSPEMGDCGCSLSNCLVPGFIARAEAPAMSVEDRGPFSGSTITVQGHLTCTSYDTHMSWNTMIFLLKIFMKGPLCPRHCSKFKSVQLCTRLQVPGLAEITL